MATAIGNGEYFMRESVIEKALFREAKKMGCMAVKFVSPGLAGVPDRILLLPHGRCVFVEVKAPGKKPRPQQEKRIRQLRELGFSVYVIDRLEQVGEVLDEIQTT